MIIAFRRAVAGYTDVRQSCPSSFFTQEDWGESFGLRDFAVHITGTDGASSLHMRSQSIGGKSDVSPDGFVVV
jgi:hypothetical protein